MMDLGLNGGRGRNRTYNLSIKSRSSSNRLNRETFHPLRSTCFLVQNRRTQNPSKATSWGSIPPPGTILSFYFVVVTRSFAFALKAADSPSVHIRYTAHLVFFDNLFVEGRLRDLLNAAIG